MSKKKKLTVDEVKLGATLFGGSLALEALLLAPKKEVTLGEKTISVQGLFALSQPYVASIAKEALNQVVPNVMLKADETVERFQWKEKLKNLVLDLLFVKLEDYSVRNVISFLFDHSSLLDKDDTVSNVKDYLSDLLEMENNPEVFVSKLTERIITGLKTLTSGTILSVLVSSRTEEVLESIVSLVIGKLFSTSLGQQLLTHMFDAVEHLENQSITGLLADTVGITEETVSDFIDQLYSKLMGEEMRERYLAKGYGDKLYSDLTSKDYDTIWAEIKENHLNELISVAMSAASAGIYLYGKYKKREARKEKKQARKAKKLEQRGKKTPELTEES